MKKLILSTIMMTFLMSFTTKTSTQTNYELLSPECCTVADNYISQLPQNIPLRHETFYNIWVDVYEVCESITNFDEFQFPN